MVEKELADFVVEVRRKSDRIMVIKVLVGSVFVNVVSVYALHVGLPEDTKKLFWDDLDMVIQDVPWSEKLFMGGDFNGHIYADSIGTMRFTAVLVSERETRKGFLCWILWWPLIC